ncbi:hypothetical protein ACOMHN_032230 [Nucella lapillus]
MEMCQWRSQLMSLLLLLLTVLVAARGAQTPRRYITMRQLYEKYGYGAGYLIFHFSLYLDNAMALQQRLQMMKANGQLYSLCQYIARYPPQCPKSTSNDDQMETVLLVAYLNTVCCHSDQAVNGSWGSWSSWSSCSVSCGSGTRRRFRTCDHPPPSNGGLSCAGSNSQTSSCFFFQPCDSVRPSCGRYKPRAKIFGGFQSEPGRYPWVAMLLNSGKFHCGCVIVDRYHVLTAGHCLDKHVKNNRLNSNTLEIIAGQFHRSIQTPEVGAQQVFVISGIRHPDYDQFRFVNDVAVLRLARPLVFNDNVSAVCIPSANDVLPKRCTVAGWGALNYFVRMNPEALQEVDLDTYTSAQCKRTFGSRVNNISRYVTQGVMCASNSTSGGKDSCRGDSGSGLMCVQSEPSGKLHYTLFGLVSSGFGCGDPGQPGFYTFIPHYLSWIYTSIATLSGRAAGRG